MVGLCRQRVGNAGVIFIKTIWLTKILRSQIVTSSFNN
jgi:hypothetical protein